ncbi:MAG: hypothetical protein RI947_1143 [Candidatus Parcubacteria bacterium]|jgi:amino acid permease
MPLFIQNILLILGTTIGAGIFTLPLALRQVGSPGYILFILVIMLLIFRTNMFYREIVDSVKAKHQFAGYVRLIMGEKMSRVAAVLLFISTCGALLAYLILAGKFLSQVAKINAETGSYIFMVLVIAFMIMGRKRMYLYDSAITLIKIALLGVIIFFALSRFSIQSLSQIPLLGTDPFVAYGSILFAMTGISIIPELKKDNHIHTSIFISQLIVAILYICFAFSFYAFAKGDQYMLDNPMQTLIFNITGFVTVLTPYLLLSWVGYDFFSRDFQFREKDSLLLIILIPVALFMFGLHSFMDVISLTGGVFLGSIAVIICQMYRKKFPGKFTFSTYAIQFIFIGGIILEILRFILKA